MNICKVDGCIRNVRARGLCSMHYQRFMHHGSTDPLESHDGLRTKYPDEYRSWYAMVRRCTKENEGSYDKYGAKGITICKEWLGGYGFKNFLRDMGEKPKHGDTNGGMPLYTIDRIDASKGYYKENCRWSDWHEQAANRKNSSSHPGVAYHRPSGLWYAHKTLNRKRRQLYFKTKEEALEQRRKWDEEDKKAPSI